MYPYWLFFSLLLLNALTHIRTSLLSIKVRYWSIEWVSIFILLVFFIGFRYRVGADWDVYVNAIAEFEGLGRVRDPGYDFLNWLAVISDQGIVLVNVIAAIFFSYGIVIFCRNQALPSLSMLVAFPYIVTVVGMGYTRQSVAIGFFMLGLVALEKGNSLRYILLVIFGALFHASALVLLPLALAVEKRHVFIKILVIILFIASLSNFFMLDNTIDTLRVTYLDGLMQGTTKYWIQSPGSTIRLLLVLLPALILLFNINRLNTNRISSSIYVIRIWIVVAVSSFFMIIPLIGLPSSTVTDRFLLYWLPLQLFVFGNVPVAYISSKYIYYILYIMIILYSTVVFAVWLFLSNNSHMWIPYSNYLWF